jgi:hypothetical protein
MSTSIPSIADCVREYKKGEATVADALETLKRHHIAPLVREDGTVDRKSASFMKVRKDVEVALVADFQSCRREVGGLILEKDGDIMRRIPDLFALSKSVMKKLSKTDADWVIATAVKNAVRRDWNRIVRAVLPKSDIEGDADDADAAPGAGTAAGDKAGKVDATTPETVLAAIQNCAASMPDASSLAVFIQSVATLAKRLESDRKAGRAILHCE